MPLSIREATRIVTKNFDRMNSPYADHLLRTNLYIYVHERNLYKRIITIYEIKKRGIS